MLDPEDFQQELELGDLPSDFKPDLNVSPGRPIPVVIDKNSRNVELFRWGLVPVWAKDKTIGYKMINARAETIAEKPSFRNAFQRRRCLILADGFYEWKKEGTGKQPYLFQLKDCKPFTFAGLWEVWHENQTDALHSCTIITTAPNELMAEYHDRMPVILDGENRWQWLENIPVPELQKMLVSFPQEEMANPVKIDPGKLLVKSR